MLLLFLGADKINYSDISLLVPCVEEFRNISSHVNLQPFGDLSKIEIDSIFIHFCSLKYFFSGVAAVLELARQFVESHCKPKNTIIFATFDLEEMGGQVRPIFLIS